MTPQKPPEKQIKIQIRAKYDNDYYNQTNFGRALYPFFAVRFYDKNLGQCVRGKPDKLDQRSVKIDESNKTVSINLELVDQSAVGEMVRGLGISSLQGSYKTLNNQIGRLKELEINFPAGYKVKDASDEILHLVQKNNVKIKNFKIGNQQYDVVPKYKIFGLFGIGTKIQKSTIAPVDGELKAVSERNAEVKNAQEPKAPKPIVQPQPLQAQVIQRQNAERQLLQQQNQPEESVGKPPKLFVPGAELSSHSSHPVDPRRRILIDPIPKKQEENQAVFVRDEKGQSQEPGVYIPNEPDKAAVKSQPEQRQKKSDLNPAPEGMTEEQWRAQKESNKNPASERKPPGYNPNPKGEEPPPHKGSRPK